MSSAPPRPPLAMRIVVLWDGGVRTHFLGPDASITLGRAADCEMPIDLPSVSRRHARLTSGEPAYIEDLGSMHGVKVRGQRIAVGQRVPINGGDSVELGEALVVVDIPRRGGAHAHAQAQELAGPPSARSLALRAAGESPMKVVDRLVDLVARSDISVLLVGETGVGKTFAAQAIHERSARARGPLAKLSCAIASTDQLEAELFGVEAGAFPGANETKAGVIELGAGGTVLLDEVGELPVSTQLKLLSVIESRELTRLGGAKSIPVDVRFISATQLDLLTRAGDGAFLPELYYRLNGVSITLPPLRERIDEIPTLAERFLADACARAGRPRLALTIDAMGALRRHTFFGNLRELRNTMERASVLAQARSAVGAEHLLFEAPPRGQSTWAPVATEPVAFVPQAAPQAPVPPVRRSPPAARLWDETDDVQRERITRALEDCSGNQTRAAEQLGISRRALVARIEEYGLPRPRKR